MTGSIQACTLDDQARGALLLVVVADLALGRSEPLPQVIVQPVEGQETGVSYGIMGEIEPSVELPGGSAILSWPQVQVAHHLVNQGPAAIAALHDDMDRWMEPTTGLDELVAATGAPVPLTVGESFAAAHEVADVPVPEEGVPGWGGGLGQDTTCA